MATQLHDAATIASERQVGLRTRLGVLTLLLLCLIQFMDVADTSIVNVALPSIQRILHFSQQNLQWVASGYVLTYGGFLLLGGRAATCRSSPCRCWPRSGCCPATESAQ